MQHICPNLTIVLCIGKLASEAPRRAIIHPKLMPGWSEKAVFWPFSIELQSRTQHRHYILKFQLKPPATAHSIPELQTVMGPIKNRILFLLQRTFQPTHQSSCQPQPKFMPAQNSYHPTHKIPLAILQPLNSHKSTYRSHPYA